jgi:hypothetical protein
VLTIHGTKTQADIITEYENTSLKKTIWRATGKNL